MAQSRPLAVLKANADTERLQLNRILQELDALALGGTVTSVSVSGSTGLTVGGSPITTSGTITLTLSANLQSWSAIAPATKLDSSAVSAFGLTLIDDANAAAARTTLGAADDTLVVHLAGTETITGAKTFNNDITITGSSRRIKADFSSAGSGATIFQTTTANTFSVVGVIPNGTNGTSLFNVFGGSDPNNTHQLQLRADPTTVSLLSTKLGTGTTRPLSFIFDATTVATLSTAGTFTAVSLFQGSIEAGYRDIPRVTGGLDRGKCYATSAGFTVNTATAEYTYSVYNDSASAITLTQGAGLTLRLSGTTTTGNRTLAARGFCTLWFNTASECIALGDVT